MSKFSAKEKVICYSEHGREIVHIQTDMEDGLYEVFNKRNSFFAHEKQLRKIRKPREYWLTIVGARHESDRSRYDMFGYNYEPIYTDAIDNAIHVREVMKKKENKK